MRKEIIKNMAKQGKLLINKVVKGNCSKNEVREYKSPILDEIAASSLNKDLYYNVRLDNMLIPLIVLGTNGIYVFIDLSEGSSKSYIRNIKVEIQSKFHFDNNTIFFGYYPYKDTFDLIDEDDNLVSMYDCVQSYKYINIYRGLSKQIRNIYGLCTLKDMLITPEEFLNRVGYSKDECIKKLNAAIEDGETFESKPFINVEPEMVDYYKSVIEEHIKPGDKDNYIIRDGKEYAKHGIKSKLLGIVVSDGYFRYSDEDEIKTYLITLFGGIFGIHHFLRGDYLKGLFYFFTAGGFGVFYIFDVIQLLCGSYSYNETEYSLDDLGRQVRLKERLYVRPISDIRLKLIGIPISLILGISLTFGIIRPSYMKLNGIFTEKSVKTVQEYIENTNY